jgi:hypothetical protein
MWMLLVCMVLEAACFSWRSITLFYPTSDIVHAQAALSWDRINLPVWLAASSRPASKG